MAVLDEYAKGAKYGYILAWYEAIKIADRLGVIGIDDALKRREKLNFAYCLSVRPRNDGPYNLYCFDCGEWVPNTANTEMLKEGMFAHSHVCVSETADQSMEEKK